MVAVFNYHLTSVSGAQRPCQGHKGHIINERQSLGCHKLQHGD